MRRDQLPPHKTATYVLPGYKTVYVSVPKAACTSLKWLVAELQGEDLERFYRSRSREVARAMTIHRRERFFRTPMLHQLPDEELAAISPGDGWFVFAVVRHPAARIWAGWQSKFLLREPRWMEEFGGESWLPRLPASTDDVRDEFARFVAALAADPEQAVLRDRHFLPQARLVGAATPYTRIYDTSEIPALLDDLGAHLRAHGWEGTLELRQFNETPLAPLASAFGPEVTAGIQSLYASDFERFGYADPHPPAIANGAGAKTYPPELLRAVGLLAERAERTGDIALLAQGFAGERRELAERNKALAEENKALRAERKQLRAENRRLHSRKGIGALAGRVRRKLARRDGT
jgi:hypothetical protein